MNGLQSNKFLTTKEVAKLLHVNDKGLPATKVTGKWFFPRRLVEDWLETHIIIYKKPGFGDLTDEGVLLLAGSDDLLFQQTLSLLHQRDPGMVGFFANLGSMGGLKSLRRGGCHIGGLSSSLG